MERNREVRRASIVGSNGFNRRRHRTNSLRDSPDEDGGVELQESVRLRDRAKKDRDRDRERDRERERERDRERDLRERSSRSKRRRAERLMNREGIGGDETSDESVNDDEDDEDEENTAAAGVRLLPQPAGSISNHHHHSHSSCLSQQHNSNNMNNVIGSNHHLQHRKTFPPASSSKVFRAAPVWKPGDEIISVSVPRKARSASTKRSHDWISSSSNNNSGGGAAGGEQVLRQASSSPVRQGLVSTPTPSPAAPMSPSSSNALLRKKLKPGGNNSGPKLKPPKASSKQSSSNPEELEIEIAEVLYGLMTQSQGPSSKKDDSREVNRSNSDGKSRVSSPISNSNSANNQILGPNSSPFQAVAPKRKRPRQVLENSSYGSRSSPISAKLDMDQTPKSEISSPNLEKISGSIGENGFEMGGNLVTQGQLLQAPEPTALTSMKMDLEFKPVAEELRENRDLIAKDDGSSPKEKESSAVGNEDSSYTDTTSIATPSVASTIIKANSVVSEVETQRQQKFEIDLMAPPPQVRSSPERETKIHLRATAADQKPALSIVDAELKAVVLKDKEDEKGKIAKEHSANVAAEERKGKETGEEAESKEEIENKGRSVDLQLDLEKSDRNGNAVVNASGIKLQQQSEKQQQQENREEPLTEKSGQSKSSLPLPTPMASWPGGLPPMGFMAPLQGVVSMDGSTVTPAPIQPLCSQPRPKRCATHCYIARSILYLQQIMKMNPFWHAAAGSASLFGPKPCNLNVMPTDLHGNMAGRGLNHAPDKGNSLANSPNHSGRDKGSQTAGTSDSAQRMQQILIQQPLPPVAASNLLGPTFVFPLNQQQAAVAAASARPSSAKSPSTTGSMASSDPSGSAGTSASAATSFNYPTMAANETQYLAFLQNNAYPFPIPPNYRGTPTQAMPLFNGSFYSSQMIHPSQLQHQLTPSTHSLQLQQAHANASVTGGSSSSQKHLPSQQQRPQSSSVDGGAGSSNSQNFHGSKSQPSQQLQQSNNQHAHPSRPRHLESELGSEGSYPTADSRGSRASMNIYGQNFGMPIHPQNFALMTPPPALASAASVSGSGNPIEKKPQQPQQSLPPHSFAMSFGPINGTNTGPGIDIASMAQNHAIFQSFQDATRQNMMAAAAAQDAQKKNFRMSEDDKSGGGESSTTDTERKSLVAKAQGGVGQSIAFTRSDLADVPVSSIQANSVIESSGRSLNVASGAARGSRLVTTNAVGAINVPNVHTQGQLQQQQMLQLKQQQQLATSAVSRSKAPVTSNGSMFSEHLNSSSVMAAKFPNALSGFPQNLVQSNSTSPAQSPQWRSSTRTPASQSPSSLASSTATTLKNLPPQHSRSPAQMHTQISFGGNQKPQTSQGQAPPSSNQASSPPMMVGSPTTSSISKGASGSPRTTTSASTNTKMGQNPSLSTQQPKNSPSNPSQKSPSILGNPHVASSSSSGAKHPMQHQSQPQQQQQLLPKNMQQAQLFFSNPYSQAQSPHSTSTSSTTSGHSGFYMQRRRPDQQQQPAQQPPSVPPTSSTGVLTLYPSATQASKGTNDPAKAIAAATTNVKGGGFPSQGIINAGTLLPAGFSYVHPVPAAVQVKPAEQKQPAGNDNLHAWQPEKK